MHICGFLYCMLDAEGNSHVSVYDHLHSSVLVLELKFLTLMLIVSLLH